MLSGVLFSLLSWWWYLMAAAATYAQTGDIWVYPLGVILTTWLKFMTGKNTVRTGKATTRLAQCEGRGRSRGKSIHNSCEKTQHWDALATVGKRRAEEKSTWADCDCGGNISLRLLLVTRYPFPFTCLLRPLTLPRHLLLLPLPLLLPSTYRLVRSEKLQCIKSSCTH